jgi:uncharacterized protein YyaL (SSP411 family)
MPVNLDFLLHYAVQYGHEQILDYVDLTLTKMAMGGIYDQAGGGFARYSVDPIWKVPHFEKMLYDNAQIIGLYASATQVFGKESFADVVRQSISFIQRQMVSPEGAFYSALDADSEGEEGKYYIWTRDELKELLKEDFDLFSDYYNINETGLWEHNHYILYRTSDPEDFAVEHGLDLKDFKKKILAWNEILLGARNKRTPPGLDDKSLTSWSSLMISGLIKAYRALGNKEYLDMAETSAGLIRDKLWSDGKMLYRNYKKGHRSIAAFHIDYALYIAACLDLFEASLERSWLDLAVDITTVTLDRFYDKETGMFNFNASGTEILISNNVETQDNVIPSSNAVMAHNLFRMGHMLVENRYLEISSSMLGKMTARFKQYPHGFADWGRLLLLQINSFYEVAVVGPSASSLVNELSKEYIPHVILVGSEVEDNLPLFTDRYHGDKTLIFVCQDNVCQLPVEDPDDAKAIYHNR